MPPAYSVSRGPRSALISSKYFPPQIGGISHMMWEICRALGPKEVCAITAVLDGEWTAHSAAGVRVYRRPLAFSRHTALQAIGLVEAIVEIAVRERPQALQLASCEEGYLALLLARFKLPFVIYAHGNEVLSATASAWPKPLLALQKANRVIANSRFTANLLRTAGVDEQRLAIVHPGCDTAHYRPIQPLAGAFEKLFGRQKCPMMLTVGGLVERKGHDLIIKAIPRIMSAVPNIVYVIVGDGPNRANLERLADSLGVRDKVVFAGHVSHQRMPEYFSLCDVFAMPSRARIDQCDVEGFGLVFLEANACERPVIGGRSGGVPDAIEHGLTGLLVDPNSSEDFASAAIKLLTDRGLAASMGARGLERVRADFTWHRVAERVRHILSLVVREAAGSGNYLTP